MNRIVITGVAGSGKTLFAFDLAFDIAEGLDDIAIIVSKHTTLIGEVSGSREDKLRSATNHIAAISKELLGGDVTEFVNIFHISEIEEMPLSHKVVVCDGAENLTQSELVLLWGKIKQGSLLILVGDPDRCCNPVAEGVFSKLISAIERGEIDCDIHRVGEKNKAEIESLKALLQ